MNFIGIDIGTTTICIVVVDSKTGKVVEANSENNNSNIISTNFYENLQDPLIILSCVKKMLNSVMPKYSNIIGIGISTQMHGILYVDKNGESVSPQITWLDGRGDLIYKDNKTYATFISENTNYKLSTGFGAVTHFWHVANNCVPKNAKCFCTIGDYIAMKLTNKKKPITHISNGAAIGMFDLISNRFSCDNFDFGMFPEICTDFNIVGKTSNGVDVVVAIGDNQAGFIGAVKNVDDSILVNIGTSGQISYKIDKFHENSAMEIRAYENGNFFLVGSTLCGGRAYELLMNFVKEIAETTGGNTHNLYEILNEKALEHLQYINKLEVCTKFNGTRKNNEERGYISNIGYDNFTLGFFAIGVLEAMAKELFDMYSESIKINNMHHSKIVMTGNGIRKNKALQIVFSNMFQMKLEFPMHLETAAFGAVISAMVGVGCFKTVSEVRNIIGRVE